MNKCPTTIKGTAGPACANGGYAKCGQMREKVSDRQGPGKYTAHSQETRELPFSTSHLTSGSHQRRWSADFSRCGTSTTVTVKKNKKEPQPPQRSISLLRPHKASNSSTNRNSCPPIGVFRSPIHPSSSSTSSSTCSCSSPPPVPTSIITGHDPLGWKLHPKSSSTSPRARNNRLSLQIPLPVIFPEPMRCPSTNSQLDYSPIPEHSAKIINPRPTSRRHSDSSAFLRSLATRPVVTLEELRAVYLYPLTLPDESDEVFGLGKEDEVKATARPRKIPPPIPEKTPATRQIAQVIAQSHQCCRPYTVETKEEVIYTGVTKPKPKDSRQTEDQGSLHGRKSVALRVDTNCDRER